MIYQTRAQRGFTLMELMVAVAIVSIVMAIAYPSYKEYANRANRTEGHSLLSDAAAAQERYYAQNFVYITTTANLTKLGIGTTSKTKKYDLEVSSVTNDGGYTLKAKQKFNDNACGDLTLTALGDRGRSGSKSLDDCWR